jgi:hypothetical protein
MQKILQFFLELLQVAGAGSRTWDEAKLGPGRVEKILDLAILNPSRGKSVLPARMACTKKVKHSKHKSLHRPTST